MGAHCGLVLCGCVRFGVVLSNRRVAQERKEPVKDYSQFGEQCAILHACQPLGSGHKLLDIGAYHATDKSNSRALIEIGWGGLLIEPSPGPLLGLVREYGTYGERVQVIGACVALEPGLVKLHVTDDATTTSDEANFETWKVKSEFYGTMLSPGITLEQISNQFGGFSFINIDAEGVSVPLFLRMMELQWEPHCICVEHDNRLAEILQAATARGYCSTFGNGTNVVLVRR